MAKPDEHPVKEFRIFIEQANAISQKPCDTMLQAFSQFISDATPIYEHLTAPPPTKEFQAFVDEALPMVVAGLKKDLPALMERARLAVRWLVPDDLLAVAGLSYVENSYTELMAWALRPDTHPASALRRQQAWLESLKPKIELVTQQPAHPWTQVGTDDGIPDLILKFEQGVIIVEAKTGTFEHAAPSGATQTVAYEAAVRKKYDLASTVPVYVVLISPNGQEAANPEARNTSYVGFALALAKLLEIEQLPPDTRAAYRMLFTHFLTCATSSTRPVRELVEAIAAWPDDCQSDGQIPLDRLNDLSVAMKCLLPERT
jgi:hypothetical protein